MGQTIGRRLRDRTAFVGTELLQGARRSEASIRLGPDAEVHPFQSLETGLWESVCRIGKEHTERKRMSVCAVPSVAVQFMKSHIVFLTIILALKLLACRDQITSSKRIL